MSQQHQQTHPNAQRTLTRRVAILGSTGSVGTQTLQTIEHLNALRENGAAHTHYKVVALAAGTDSDTLAAQRAAYPDAVVELADDPAHTNTTHPDAGTRALDASNPDLVVAAIVGNAGLPSTLAAAERGIDTALANKESLVVAGDLVTAAARASGAALLPVDSEHASLHQCLLAYTDPGASPPMTPPPSVAHVTLTASGGALRDLSDTDYANATPEQALNHPTWSMGAKVTLDSATLVNKGLELIEAHHLFGLRADQLSAIVHPQSTVHAIVRTIDHAVIAQLGPTDMRCPIQHALTHPTRAPSACEPVDLAALGALTFENLHPTRHRAVHLALRAIEQGHSAGATFAAASETAAQAFLDRRIPITDITRVTEHVMDTLDPAPIRDLSDAHAAVERAAAAANERITADPKQTTTQTTTRPAP